MTRFYKIQNGTEVNYFRTFKNLLINYGQDIERYNTFYRKLEYHNFTDVKFSFGIVSRCHFVNGT